MQDHEIVSRDAWIAARTKLLAMEKEFTRQRDALSRQRRALPWVRVEKEYVFEGPGGRQTLPEIFQGRHQLIVQHFMFDPEWEAGCKSCSFWADSFDRIPLHLAHRDVTFVAISRAPFAKLAAFKARMGWRFLWLSSAGNDFNFDYRVSFRPEDLAAGTAEYNYAPLRAQMTELPGVSVFYRDDAGTVFHTYSCYARGLDMLNSAYHYLDLVPKGRDEDGLPRPMAWVRLHDMYEEAPLSVGR
jgi:predicted dithiol-disulfide oxidoreductase (DUF899 family)